MDIIHFSMRDYGGAGIAAYRYHKLMQKMGHNSILYVLEKTRHDDSIKILRQKNSIYNILHTYYKKVVKKLLNNQYILNRVSTKEQYCYYNFRGTESNGLLDNLDSIPEKVDLVFVHWHGDFLNSFDLKNIYQRSQARFIFSMMDMEPITGGCHYPWECTKFSTNCLDCPALPLDFNGQTLSHQQLMAKAANYSCINPDIFSSSDYDLQAAQRSLIPFRRYYRIYYPVDDSIFHPSENTNKNDNIVIFSNVNSPSDPRKGFNYLLMILSLLDKVINRRIDFLCLSNSEYKKYSFNNIHFVNFDFCNDINSLSNLYRKADLFLCASIEDSAPLMLQEALMSGLPTIAFDTGTAKQFIQNGINGFVVDRYDVKSFVEKLVFVINNMDIYSSRRSDIHSSMVSLCGIKAVESSVNFLINDK